MNERILVLRKALGLTQTTFGERIGVTATAISKIENGERIPSEQLILGITRAFQVSSDWLRTGEGEMFIESDDSLITAVSAQYGLDTTERAIVEAFLLLPPDLREGVKRFILDVANRVAEDEEDPDDALRARLDAEIEAQITHANDGRATAT